MIGRVTIGLLIGLCGLAACDKADEAATPDKPSEAAPEPAKPGGNAMDPARPAQPLQPAQPVQPAQPAQPGEPARPVTSPTQQSYPMDAIKKIPDNCSKPYVILSTAPNKVGVNYEWTWSKQAMLANQQFKVVSGEPAVPGQVSFEVHLASKRFMDAWVLVAKCNDGGTCNYLAAMYKTTVKGSQAQPVCGKLPMDLSPATFRKPVLIELGNPTASLPGPKDGTGLCARLHACKVAMNPAAGASENIGFDCQKAPSKFKIQCATKYPCAAVMSCLGE